MQYFISILLIIVIVILLFNNIKYKDNIEKQNLLINNIMLKELSTNNESMLIKFNELEKSIRNTTDISFKELINTVDSKLDNINRRVEDRLSKGFEDSNKTFTEVIKRLSLIDAAQKNMDNLSKDVISLQKVLTDKKVRGVFGEIQLNHILESVFGAKRGEVYDIQYKIKDKIVDAIIFAPEPFGKLGIDSKFPLENYKNMYDNNITENKREEARKNFKINIKKHIDDISSKYIIRGETADQAIMFLPAEAIFAEINAYHEDVLTYAYSKKVWITSPTTLMATLSIIQMTIINSKRDKYSANIQLELSKLSKEFERYSDRWQNLMKSIDKIQKDANDINITSDKISKKFDIINNVKFEQIEE